MIFFFTEYVHFYSETSSLFQLKLNCFCCARIEHIHTHTLIMSLFFFGGLLYKLQTNIERSSFRIASHSRYNDETLCGYIKMRSTSRSWMVSYRKKNWDGIFFCVFSSLRIKSLHCMHLTSYVTRKWARLFLSLKTRKLLHKNVTVNVYFQ